MAITNTAMRFLGIIPDEVSHQSLIEGFRFVQFIYIPVNKLFLNGLVKPLQVAIGLRIFRIIKEVYEAIILTRLSKVFFEFTAIIGLDSLSGKRGNL